jgi:hypothetical protein
MHVLGDVLDTKDPVRLGFGRNWERIAGDHKSIYWNPSLPENDQIEFFRMRLRRYVGGWSVLEALHAIFPSEQQVYLLLALF